MFMISQSSIATACLSLTLMSIFTGQLAAAETSYLKDVRPLFETYCFSCHGAEKQKADLNLEQIKDEATKLWRGVIDQIHIFEMPPKKAMKQPTAEERDRMIAGLNGLKKYDGPPDPGRVTIRRLNRTEYDYTIRDLFGLDLRTARSAFPSDDVGEGFDNIGDVLSLPPILLEKYLEAATAILDQAIVAQPINISLTGAQLPATHGTEKLPAQSEPGTREFTQAGELTLNVAIPEENKYTFRASVGASQAGKDPVMLVLKVNNQVVKEFKISGTLKDPKGISHSIPLTKGAHRLTLAFTNPYSDPPIPKEQLKPGQKQPTPAMRKVNIERVDMTSPNAKTAKVPINKRIFIVEPSAELKPRDAAKNILGNMASLAFRRPASTEQVERLLSIFDLAINDDETYEEAIKYALKAVLVSPSFIFRLENDRKATLPNNTYQLDDYEIASRLSYFLWSSMPDQELFDLAKQGKLKDPQVIAKQTLRMLNDDKARALGETFGEQWLTLRSLETVQPDPKKFPTYNKALRQSMHEESRLYFDYVMKENRPLLEFIDSDYTFLDERLAKHYNISNVTGANMRKVTLTDRNRGGVLSMASILTVTSQPGRTSPVKRGHWVLEQIIGEPPPPPPPAVEPLPEEGAQGTAGLTLRQRMEKHRQDPVCASCHTKMDAIGFGLENYDAIGRWRTQDSNLPLDTAGTLPGGISFKNPQELKKVFLDRKESFTQSITEKMLIFALGRGLHDYDDSVVQQIAKTVAKDNFRFHTLITSITASFPFTHRRIP